MLDAIKNEMDKGGGASDTVSIDQRFRKQIRVVMETTARNNKELTAKEARTLLSLSKQMGNTSSAISALLVASQAHYNIKDNEQSEAYADQAIKQSEAAMKNNDPAGYPTWKSCMMLKGALLAAKRKWEAAIELYDRLAEEATSRQDIFFIMEGHRISGHLYYVRGRMQPAFEKLLLAMVAGSYLDKKVIRESTFLHAAHLALFIGKSIKDKNEINILENQLEDWIGDDWRELLNDGELEKTTIKVKRKFPLSIS
jgi:tetratricopeptide (TPR) repeat protein